MSRPSGGLYRDAITIVALALLAVIVTILVGGRSAQRGGPHPCRVQVLTTTVDTWCENGAPK